VPGSPDQPRLWIVTGVPGAGKSTTARALALTVPRGVHIEGDALQRLIVSGGEPPHPAGTPESDRQIELNVRNQCLLARSFMAEDFVVVIDYVVSTRARLAQYLDLLQPHPVGFVVLDPTMAVADQRDRDRLTKRMLDRWRHLAADMRELAGAGLWLDTSTLSVDEAVAAIRAAAGSAVVDRTHTAAEVPGTVPAVPRPRPRF
jgi:predicted kinase